MSAIKTFTVTRLRTFALAAMAATTLGLSSFAAAPPAAAATYTWCSEAQARFQAYIEAGDYWASRGNNGLANFFYNQAKSVADSTYCP